MHVPSVVSRKLHVSALKLIVYLVFTLCYGIKGATGSPLFPNQKIPVMHWSEPRSHNKPCELSCSRDFGFKGKSPSYFQIVYNDSLAFWPLIQCVGHDSCRVLLVFQPCLHFCRWVLPLHHHPLWHVTKRLGYKVGA